MTAEDVAALFGTLANKLDALAAAQAERHREAMDALAGIRAEQAAQKRRIDAVAAVQDGQTDALAELNAATRDILSGMGGEEGEQGEDKLAKTLEKLVEGVEEVPGLTVKGLMEELREDGAAPAEKGGQQAF